MTLSMLICGLRQSALIPLSNIQRVFALLCTRSLWTRLYAGFLDSTIRFAGSLATLGGAPFTYDVQIGTDHIRLLKFTKATAVSLTPSLEIETFKLEECPKYIALSYTWGPPIAGPKDVYDYSERVFIHIKHVYGINWSYFKVYPNLLDALWHMQRTYPDHYFWADAICICQTDDKEKESQVSIMDEIYKRAWKTVVWLGRETADTERALQVIVRSRDAARNEVRRAVTSYHITDPPEPMSLSTYEQYGMQPILRRDWDCLVDVFTRRWFGRVWVQQELALSKEVEFWFGTRSILWDDIEIFATFAGVTTLTMGLLQVHPPNPIYNALTLGLARASGLSFVRQLCQGKETDLAAVMDATQTLAGAKEGAESTLLKLLLFSNGLDATNNRDKLFAHFGLLKKMSVDPIPAVFSPALGYKQPVGNIYSDMGKAICQGSGTLHVLTLGGENPARTEQVKGLPTWLPDLSLKAHPSPIMGPSLKSLRLPDASKCAGSPGLGFDFEGDKIHVRGFRLGDITVLGEKWNEMRDGKFSGCINLIHQLDETYPYTGQPRVEAFWRALVFDHDLATRPAPERLGAYFGSWIGLLIFARLDDEISARKPPEDILKANELLYQLGDSDETGIMPTRASHGELLNERVEMLGRGDTSFWNRWNPGAVRFETYFLFAMGFRRPLVTSSRYVAVGPEWAEITDEIWIISGCPTPMILRKTKVENGIFHARVVGEAFVHGVMQGEAVTDNTNWSPVCLS